jgi:hypothetical protein
MDTESDYKLNRQFRAVWSISANFDSDFLSHIPAFLIKSAKTTALPHNGIVRKTAIT